MALKLVRVYQPNLGTRVGLWIDEEVYDITASVPSITTWLKSSVGRVQAAIDDLEKLAQKAETSLPATIFRTEPSPDHPHCLAPIDDQEVWASGVTYERSRIARQEESVDGGDVYARVYNAQRPELFFKAQGRRVIGSRGEVGIRADATWSVPEPELVVVANPALEPVGFSIGNDVSSRDIEGENPLYLPQAKVYTASCSMGPGILLKAGADWLDTTIKITINRADQPVFNGEIHTSKIKRSIDELLGYLGRSNEFPNGVALLTGTGIVPPNEFTLAAGDVVEISIDGIGTLINTVKVV